MVERFTTPTRFEQQAASTDSSRTEYLNELKANPKLLSTTDATTSSYQIPKLEITDNSKTTEVSEKEKVLQKEKELESKYGVKFAQEGDRVKEKRNDRGEPTGQWVTARNPTMDELRGVEAALKHSEPSNKTTDGKPLKINFAKENFFSGGGGKLSYEPAGTDGEHSNEAQLNIWPAAKQLVPTNAEIKGQPSHDNNSLEQAITHELAHASQDHMDGLGPEKDAQYKRDMGWVPLHEPPNQRTDWAMKGKDGNLYKLQMEMKSNGQVDAWWEAVEGNAGYDEKGDYKGKSLNQRKTFDEMRDAASVKPITDYFPVPEEMGADGMTAYRVNAEQRAQLRRESPALYEAMRKQDQAELDKVYGAGAKIRLPDGTIADNTDVNRQKIAAFENGIRPS